MYLGKIKPHEEKFYFVKQTLHHVIMQKKLAIFFYLVAGSKQASFPFALEKEWKKQCFTEITFSCSELQVSSAGQITPARLRASRDKDQPPPQPFTEEKGDIQQVSPDKQTLAKPYTKSQLLQINLFNLQQLTPVLHISCSRLEEKDTF